MAFKNSTCSFSSQHEIVKYRERRREIRGHDIFHPQNLAKSPERSGRGLSSNVVLVLEDGGSGVLTYFCSKPGPEVASRQGSKAFEQAANQA